MLFLEEPVSQQPSKIAFSMAVFLCFEKIQAFYGLVDLIDPQVFYGHAWMRGRLEYKLVGDYLNIGLGL